MLQVEAISGGEVIQQLEVDGNQVFTHPDISPEQAIPDFMRSVIDSLPGENREERIKSYVHSAGNQASLKRGNGARLYKKGQGEFVSYAPDKSEALEAETSAEVQSAKKVQTRTETKPPTVSAPLAAEKGEP